jgi:rhamnose utilization protein RhaD (predicted bifunctional aldolase and dehydrogenase)
MGIVSSQFNWVSTPTAYTQVTNWRAKQKAFNTQVQSNMAAMSDVFAASVSSLGSGMAEIAARKAAARISTELQAKITKAQLDTYA